MKTRTLAELTQSDKPAIGLVRQVAAASKHPCELLPPSSQRDEVLVAVQVTTHSTLGAILHETGGVLIDHGWLRFLGSGHERLRRTLTEWNAGRGKEFLLIADDVVGGFFALNGGSLGNDFHAVYYFAPDTLRWESTQLGYTDFFIWCLSDRLEEFYSAFRWPAWETDVTALSGDQCWFFAPPLWSSEGKAAAGRRSVIPVAEAFGMQMDFARQLG